MQQVKQEGSRGEEGDEDRISRSGNSNPILAKWIMSTLNLSISWRTFALHSVILYTSVATL